MFLSGFTIFEGYRNEFFIPHIPSESWVSIYINDDKKGLIDHINKTSWWTVEKLVDYLKENGFTQNSERPKTRKTVEVKNVPT